MMETNKSRQDKIDSAFEAFDAIETVNVSPFFKDKTMQVLFAEQKVTQEVWRWFTPQIQLAALLCLVVLNVIAFTKLEASSSYDENVSVFAESYGLSRSDDDTALLNN